LLLDLAERWHQILQLDSEEQRWDYILLLDLEERHLILWLDFEEQRHLMLLLDLEEQLCYPGEVIVLSSSPSPPLLTPSFLILLYRKRRIYFCLGHHFN
jgi:hypothetical protein